MKKKSFLIIAVSTFLLGGCSLPFTEKQNKKIDTYVENNVEIVKSAENINQEIRKYLNDTTSKSASFDKDSVAERLQISKKNQTDLFKNISEENVTEELKEYKTIYMKLLNEYLKTYDVYEKAIKTEDSEVLKAAVTESKMKKEGLDAMYLNKLNEKLEKSKAKKLTNLTEVEKTKTK